MPTFVGLLSACRLCVGSVQTQDESEEEVVPGREDDLKFVRCSRKTCGKLCKALRHTVGWCRAPELMGQPLLRKLGPGSLSLKRVLEQTYGSF